MGNSLIKWAHRKRRNDSGAVDKNRNRTPRNGKNSDRTPVAGASNESQHRLSSPIFKLNGHCFDKLFEYLSLKDLHSLGQTCKSMQQVTGEFFTRNYSAAKFNCLSNGIYFIDTDGIYGWRNEIGIEKCIPIPGFIRLITWIAIEKNIFKKIKYHKTTLNFDYEVLTHSDSGHLKYFELNADEFKSVKKLSLRYMRLNKRTVTYISKILPNIEVLELIGCTVFSDLYDVLLKYCEIVRNIQLIGMDFRNKNKYKWLLRKYDKLEQLGLGDLRETNRIDELCTFFERNPNVRTFSCELLKLSSNKDALLNCKVDLDTLELIPDMGLCVCECGEQKTPWDLLLQFHTHGFYKRLHINAGNIYHEENCELAVSAMPFLQQLSVVDRTPLLFAPLLTHLIEYAETCIQAHYNYDAEIPLEKLMNVERLHFAFRESHDILRVIQRLGNLRKIKIFGFKSSEILELNVLNSEREKLAGARKVTIYVPDAVYLATKWATENGTTNFNMIEMKRANSCEWHRHCDHFTHKTLHLPPGIF